MNQQSHSWYTKTALQGDFWISMGISYWSTGQRDRGLEFTERGMKILEDAVDRGLTSRDALLIAYRNLATMHRQQGDDNRSRQYTARLNELQNSSRRR